MEDLLDDLDSATAHEREEATRLVTANEPHDEDDFTSDNEQDDEDDDASIVPFITSESLDRYRKNGPFGKLHNIGVHLRQNSQLLGNGVWLKYYNKSLNILMSPVNNSKEIQLQHITDRLAGGLTNIIP
jgi:hypothetical protein